MSWHRIPLSPRLVVGTRNLVRTRDVVALSGASDWRRRLADRLGVAALPARRVFPASAGPPWPHVGWGELDEAIGNELPGARVLAAALPRQAGRERLSLLVRMTGNQVIVKLGALGTLAAEAQALELLARDPLPGIAAPEPLAAGTVTLGGEPIAYLATGSVSLRRQRPALDEPLRSFERDLTRRLSALPRSPATATDAVPVHGDLTPWNLRRTDRGLALFDWEAAGWGVPGSDVAHYRSACNDVRPPWSRSHHLGRGRSE